MPWSVYINIVHFIFDDPYGNNYPSSVLFNPGINHKTISMGPSVCIYDGDNLLAFTNIDSDLIPNQANYCCKLMKHNE